MEGATKEEQKTADEMIISLNLNAAQGCISEKKYAESIKYTTVVLTKESSNVKALFRRGTAHLNMGNFDKAKNDLVAAYKLDSKNVEVLKSIELLKQKVIDANLSFM